MTVQTTTLQHSKHEVLRMIGTTVFTCAVLGGVALWQVWPSGPAAAPATRATTSAAIAFMPEPESPLNALVAGSTGGEMERFSAWDQEQGYAAAVAAGVPARPAAAAPARTILTVGSVDQVAEAYSRFVEHMRVMDGYEPFDVTVVIASAAQNTSTCGLIDMSRDC
jgi:hypothetical protein